MRVRAYRKSAGKPSHRPRSNDLSHVKEEADDRKAQLALIRQQTEIAKFGLWATFLLSVALFVVAAGQWLTSESVASIERAKAQPRFRTVQETEPRLAGFLPRTFNVQPVSGVFEAAEATASTYFLIFYPSMGKGAKPGICRASFPNYFAWTTGSLAFGQTEAAARFMEIASNGPVVSVQPIHTIVDVNFIDLFGRPRNYPLLIFGGQSTSVRSSIEGQRWSNMELNLQISEDGTVYIFRTNIGPIPQECVDALRAMDATSGLKVARHYSINKGRSYFVVREDRLFADQDKPITSTFPMPHILPESKP